MTNLYKILCGGLMASTIAIPFIHTAQTNKQILSTTTVVGNDDYLQPTHAVTSVSQQLLTDDKKENKKDHTRSVRFDNFFKKIYLSPDNKNINPKSLLISIKQTTTPTNNSTDYGYFNYADSENQLDKDLNHRIEDWSSIYLDNLSVKFNPSDCFGISSIGLSLPCVSVWPSNKQLSELDVPCSFRNENYEPCNLAKTSDFHFDKINIKNEKDKIIGVPFFKIKEENITNKKHKSKDHLIAYWIKTSSSIGSILSYNPSKLPIASYDLSHLFSISGGSFTKKTIHLGLNADFMNKAKSLDEHHNEIRSKLETDWNKIHKFNPTLDRKVFDRMIDMNILSTDNVKSLESPFPFWFMDVFTQMMMKESKEATDYAKSLGFKNHDNPWKIIGDLRNKMKLTLNYAINDSQHPGQWINQTKKISFLDLENGVDIPISQENDYQYKFKFDSLVSDEINTPDAYVGSQSIRKMDYNTNLLNCVDNVYEINKPIAISAELKQNNLSFNRNYTIDEIENNELLKEYVILKTNFDETADWTLLNQDEYTILRNPQCGTIKISLTLNGIKYEQTYDGFKRETITFKDIDSTILENNLIADDLSDEKIKQLMHTIGINMSYLNDIHFEMQDVNNDKGSVVIRISECNQPDYINKTFKIFNLKPYFIQQNTNIDNSILKKKPSEITESEFRKGFIKMSDEFISRHMKDLSISLTPNDKENKLFATITFTDVKTNEQVKVNYNYDFNKKSINQTSLVCLGGAALIIVLILGLLIYRKAKKPKLKELAN